MKKRVFSILLVLAMLVGMIPMNSLTAYATEPTEAEQTAETLPVLLGVNVTLADILDTSDGWKPLPVDKSAVFEPGTGTASVNFSNSVLYTNGSFSTPVATVSAGGRYYFYITVTSLPEYYPVDYSKISVDHINVTMYDYKVDFLYTSEYSSGAYTGMKFCFMATHDPAPQLKFDEIVLKDGEYLKSGTPITSTTKPSGGYAYYKDGVLELNNYNSTFGNLYLKDMESIEIKVVGSNVLSKIEETYTSTNTKKYTDITFTGDGSLNVKSNVTACVKTSGDVTVKRGNLTFGGGNGLSGLSAASLTVNGGELVLKGTTSAINSGCRVDTNFISVDEGGTPWDGETDLSTYKYLRFVVPYIYVGGVKLYDGDYLAVGATEPQSTEPSGGYAYYKDGELTLNNYSYEGIGYEYDIDADNYSVIYAEEDLLITLTGNNTLVQTADTSDSIFVKNGSLTIGGTGSLTNTDNGYGILASQDITINGGTIVTTGQNFGIYSPFGDITINGGDITASGKRGMRARDGSVIVNGGKVTAVGSNCAIAYGTSFTVVSKMEILASTTANGELGEYVAANHDSYKNIVVKKKLGGDIYVGGVGMYSGDYLAVGATETTIIQPSGGYAYYEDGTLTLNNYSFEGEGYTYLSSDGSNANIYTKNNLAVNLIGTNNLNNTASNGNNIYTAGALTIGGTGSLTCTSSRHGVYAVKDIVINGGDIYCDNRNGIWSDESLVINDGSIIADVDFLGLNADKDVVINGGTVTATGGNAIYAEKNVIINGGTVTATARGGYAIYYKGSFTVADGLTIQASTTVDGTLGKYVAAYHDSYKKIVIGPCAFTIQPFVGAMETGANQTVVWGVNFTPVKTEILQYSGENSSYVVKTMSNTATKTSLAVSDNEYCVRVYYSDTEYVTSDKFYVTEKVECIWVGGVVMFSGDYLAVGATETQSTEPSGGYAYYEDGTLTLNNYNYEGAGYCYHESFDTVIGEIKEYASIYAATGSNTASGDLTIRLVGTNNLVQNQVDSRNILTELGFITIEGSGSLSCSGAKFGIRADFGVYINEGTINVTAEDRAIFSKYGDVEISGGNVTASGEYGIATGDDNGSVYVLGGTLKATGTILAIDMAETFETDESLKVWACVYVNGMMSEYVAEDINRYRQIMVLDKVAEVSVGGVDMYDGDYLAVGATETTTSKPSGGYAYYKDGVLTLNNYSYEGQGRKHGSYYMNIIAAGRNLTIELVGNNALIQTNTTGDNISVDRGSLTIGGAGSLTASAGGYNIVADKAITINGGTIICNNNRSYGIASAEDIIVNGGDITVTGNKESISASGDLKVNGGNITAICTSSSDYYSAIYATNFVIGDHVTVKASTTADGELGEYVAANHDSYKKIVIEPDAGNVLPGDANDDGKVNNRDLGLLQRYLNDWDVPLNEDAMDVNDDGKVNNRDLGLLQRYLNDWDVVLK